MMITPYEALYRCAEPVLPVLYGKVRRDLRELLDGNSGRLLDVGARKSPYTIGLDLSVTLLDMPREGEIMRDLELGFTDDLIGQVRRRRSNVERVVREDMTRCSLPSSSYDGVACVEVIEHINDDQSFVQQIARVLKPNGFAYFTTPNGDYIRNEPPNYNPDHVRHYRRAELNALLEEWFDEVRVFYGVRTGRNRVRGLTSFSIWRPVRTLQAMASNLINHVESRGVEEQAQRTAHLFAIAQKPRSG